MGDKQEPQKGSVSGKMASLVSLLRKGNVITGVASFLKKNPQERFVIKMPLNQPLGKRVYTVESEFDPLTFTKRKDAEAFKHLISISNRRLNGVIVIREVTDEGYIPTYGDGK